MKLDKKGQALIEFVLVLPVLLLLIFAFIDFGKIILCRNHLESVMSDVVLLNDEEKIKAYLQKDTSYQIKYQEKKSSERTITLSTDIDLITPGLSTVLHNPYHVTVERRVIE